MNRRDFLKMSSLATMSAVGMWTGITEAFAHAPEQKEKYRSYNTGLASSMEYRKLGALDVFSYRPWLPAYGWLLWGKI